MIKILKTISWVIFATGVVLALGQYLVSNCDRFDWVQERLMPEYTDARTALGKIDGEQTLAKEDRGFDEIEKIVIAHLVGRPTSNDKIKILPEADLDVISHSMGSTSLDFDGNKVFLGGRVCQGEKKISFNNLDRTVLKNGVAALRDHKLLPIADWVFWLGLTLIVFSKLVDTAITKMEKKG